jgi:gamma-butyrobetaine dioxygenase
MATQHAEATVRRRDGNLAVTWSDRFSHEFHPLWLRERSFDPANKDATTGHRVQEAAFLPPDLALADVRQDGDAVRLTFSDGHQCSYELDDLRTVAEQPLPQDLIGAKQYWDSTLDPWPWYEFDELQRVPATLLALLDDVAGLGLALVRGTPATPDGLKQFTDLLGPVRQTNDGGIADVRSIAQAYDLSMTARALEPHVDNPYRLPSPGYTFLHCVENSAEGGESFLVDGFAIAERIRRDAPEAFTVLSTTPVYFFYRDEQAILESYGPLIELRPDGDYFRTRFHNRADQVIATDVSTLERFYSARRRYAELVWSPVMSIEFKLNPGELYVADNYRLFHGRRKFQPGTEPGTGNRWMRQCYVDRDVISSRQKTLRRSLDAKPWQPR